jgi:ribosomal protein S18 acetylase RimI-like enzyme
MNANSTIAIREACPADAAAIARVHVDTWRTSYASILPAEFLAGLAYERSESIWGQALTKELPHSCMLVAETAADEVVGFVFGAQEREDNPLYRGEIFAIYVRAAHQSKGVGRRLFSNMVRHFVSEGIDSMLLRVFKDNHTARQFYASLGGTYLKEKPIKVGDSEMIEVAYGWRDITGLADE